jgi:hypothetical protein
LNRSRLAPRFRVMAGIYPCPVSQVRFGALVLTLECSSLVYLSNRRRSTAFYDNNVFSTWPSIVNRLQHPSPHPTPRPSATSCARVHQEFTMTPPPSTPAKSTRPRPRPKRKIVENGLFKTVPSTSFYDAAGPSKPEPSKRR